VKDLVPKGRVSMQWRATVTCFLVTGALVLGLLEACGSTASTPTDGGTKLSNQCLTSIDENGAKCTATPDLLCYADIPCSPTPQQADCYCVSGAWQCSYSAQSGAVIAPGSTPTCFPEIDAAPGVCPTAEPDVTVACGEPGLICTYRGVTCPDSDSGLPNLDTCQCAPTTAIETADGSIVSGNGGGLVWTCDRDLCNPTSDAAVPPPPDAGMPDLGAPDMGTTPEASKDAKGGKDAKGKD
jgi:hypothetical protein